MPIIVNLDVMLARRKMKSKDLADAIGISETNLSLLKQGHVKGVRFGTNRISTTSLSMRARSGTIRFIQTFHDPVRSTLVPALD